MRPMSALGPLDAHERVLRVYLRTVLSLTATLLAGSSCSTCSG